MTYAVVPLSDDHILDYFDCLHDDNRLGEWLQKHAKEYHSKDMCKIWMLIENDSDFPVGYFTLSSHQIGSDGFTKKQRSGFASSHPHPAQLLGKFALDKGVQGKGLSAFLMYEVFRKYIAVCELTGSRFLVTQVRTPKLASFYANYGFQEIRKRDQGLTDMVIDTESVREKLRSIRLGL